MVEALNSLASEDSLQLGASSRVITRRASRAVSSTSNARPGTALALGEVAQEADVERRVVGDEHTCRRANSRNAGSADSIGGASATIELVMPVSTAMNGGIAVCGLTRVWNSPSTSPPRTLTAPISVIIEPASAEPPVVSRSTTQNVMVAQRPAQLVETALRLPSRRRTLNVAAGQGAHDFDGRGARRQFPAGHAQ